MKEVENLKRDPYLFETQYGLKSIELVQGDITALEDHVDVLAFSAFNKAYYPTRGTICKALFDKGTDVWDYEKHPALDLRSSKGVWISSEINNDNIKASRLACLEFIYELRESTTDSIKDKLNSLFGMLAAAEYCGIKVGSISVPIFGGHFTDVDHAMMLRSIMEEAKKALKTIKSFEKVIIVAYSDSDYEIAEQAFDKILGRTSMDISTLNEETELKVLTDRIVTDINIIAKHFPDKDKKDIFIQLAIFRNIFNEKGFAVCIAARKLLEILINYLYYTIFKYPTYINKTLNDKINTLNKDEKLPKIIPSYMHLIRVVGNHSAHAPQDHKDDIDNNYILSSADIRNMLFCLAAVISYYKKLLEE